ncbi:MAG: hypothetical protein HC869_09990 [Rhodospirillales bacterium]|nr:hypothetical protein [Rhodospirillales bacterium]
MGSTEFRDGLIHVSRESIDRRYGQWHDPAIVAVVALAKIKASVHENCVHELSDLTGEASSPRQSKIAQASASLRSAGFRMRAGKGELAA